MDEYENEFSLQASPASLEHSITSLSSCQSRVGHSFAALHTLQQQTHQAMFTYCDSTSAPTTPEYVNTSASDYDLVQLFTHCNSDSDAIVNTLRLRLRFGAVFTMESQSEQGTAFGAKRADHLNALKRMPWQNTDLTTYFTKVDHGHVFSTTTTDPTTLVYRDDSSRDSGISSLDSYSTTAFGTGSSTRMNETAKMPTDFSPLAMELGNQHGPTNVSLFLPFQECSPATACESETDIVLSAKMGGPFNLLNTEKDNSDYLPRVGNREPPKMPPKAQPAKHIAHNTTPYPPTYNRQISAPLSKRPLQLRDITNTNAHADVSPTARFFQKSQDGGPLAKLSRKRSSVLEEDAKKRRKSNEQMFLHDHEGIPMSVRSMPRVHSSSVLESSFDRMKNNPNSYHSPDPLEHYSLKTVEKPQTASAAFRSISADTLCRLLDSMTEEQFRKKFFLVDCRYPFEFSGGHIRHAVNIFDPIHIEATFYPSKQEDFRDINSRIPIFYCEFSQKRGPQMAHELRKIDRMHNEKHYPHVDYKEIYILDYGYNKFFDKAKLIDFCEPVGYTPMLHPAHKADLKQYSFHKKATMFSTDLKGNGKYFNGRKLSAHSRYSGSVRRQMSLGNRSISDFEANFSSSSSSFSISDSPVSSTSVQAVSSGCSASNSSIHLPIQRLARMTMQSPPPQPSIVNQANWRSPLSSCSRAVVCCLELSVRNHVLLLRPALQLPAVLHLHCLNLPSRPNIADKFYVWFE